MSEENKQRTNSESSQVEVSARDKGLNDFVDQVSDPKTKEYIKQRVISQMKYYAQSSRKYKKQYESLSRVSIILGAVIPVGILLLEGPLVLRILVAALSTTAMALTAFLLFNNYKDLWLTARNTREALLHTLYYYFTDTDQFGRAASQEEKDRLLIEACEAELANEHGLFRAKTGQ